MPQTSEQAQAVMDSFPPFYERTDEATRRTRGQLDVLQVNVGRLCNLACRHCHMDAGPARTEVMAREPLQQCLDVAAGRGFAEEADLDLARALADKLGGGLACSRPLTEGVNWLPTELYVGVSGLMLSPKVYVAAGISGQMQHMVGCNRSGAMFAINKDKNAPVFKQCDYGLIGDVKDVLPKLVAAL